MYCFRNWITRVLRTGLIESPENRISDGLVQPPTFERIDVGLKSEPWIPSYYLTTSLPRTLANRKH